jgi:hypothetical protein
MCARPAASAHNTYQHRYTDRPLIHSERAPRFFKVQQCEAPGRRRSFIPSRRLAPDAGPGRNGARPRRRNRRPDKSLTQENFESFRKHFGNNIRPITVVTRKNRFRLANHQSSSGGGEHD